MVSQEFPPKQEVESSFGQSWSQDVEDFETIQRAVEELQSPPFERLGADNLQCQPPLGLGADVGAESPPFLFTSEVECKGANKKLVGTGPLQQRLPRVFR